jgi:hypothetical protein
VELAYFSNGHKVFGDHQNGKGDCLKFKVAVLLENYQG